MTTGDVVLRAREGDSVASHPMLEIDSIEACRAWLAPESDRPPAALQALDLRHVDGFVTGQFDGSLFLGCKLTVAQAGALTAGGAVVIADDGSRPYRVHRSRLYSPEEIFDGFAADEPASVHRTFDARVYERFVAMGGEHTTSIAETLAQRLHDHSVSDALHEALAGHRPVAIMGGHGVERADPAYELVATMARTLTRDGYLMLSGGGPGAMEATHLGAWMAHFDDAELGAALTVLGPRAAGAPSGKEYADDDWLHRAFAVRKRWPLDAIRYHSVGIPTWLYGHEPPAAFATQIAKYFANSVREEGLLAIATHGVVFTPGSAGTIQEIFQDAAQNHYASFGPPSPMVLVGVEYWTEHFPVWPLLQALARDRDYADLITLTDDAEEVVERVRGHRRA